MDSVTMITQRGLIIRIHAAMMVAIAVRRLVWGRAAAAMATIAKILPTAAMWIIPRTSGTGGAIGNMVTTILRCADTTAVIAARIAVRTARRLAV